jgi:hypothetical protein
MAFLCRLSPNPLSIFQVVVSFNLYPSIKDIHGDERSGEIRFHFLKNPFRWLDIGLLDNAKIGQIKIGMSIDPKRIEKHKVNNKAKCKLAFEVALKIAKYLKPMWSEEPRLYYCAAKNSKEKEFVGDIFRGLIV